MNAKNPHGLVGYRSPGRRASRIVGRRNSPFELCRICGQEQTDERFRDHPRCFERARRAGAV